MKIDSVPYRTPLLASFAILSLGALALLPLAESVPSAISQPVAGDRANARGAAVSVPYTVLDQVRHRMSPAGTSAEDSRVVDSRPTPDTGHAIAPRHAHPVGEALYETRNAEHGLHVGFTAEGIHVVTGSAGAGLAMRLSGVGYGERLQDVTEAALFAAGNRIDYHRSTAVGSAFTEWYVNAGDGLEQGFTFAAPVDTRRAGEQLVVELRCSGDFVGKQTPAGDAVVFATADGGTALHYDGLYAFDAEGRALPSHMELDGDRLALVVDDADATYPVTVDPKVKGGKGGKGGNEGADIEFRDAATDAILSDRGDGDTAPADYSDGVDKVKALYTIYLETGSKGIQNPRRVQFDLSTARLLPRSTTQQYVGNHGDLPPGVGTNGILSATDIRISNLRGRTYVPDANSSSGWVVGPDYDADAMQVDEVGYVGLNVNLVRNNKSEIIWRLFFGPGDTGPVRALDAQPVKVKRTSETTWTVEALDLGKGIRAALLERVGTTSSHTYQTVDHYSMPFRMTLTKQ